MSALAILGHSERFSPGEIRFEVGRQIALNSPTGRPTSEPFWPGENLSEWPKIARALRNWPKCFKNHRAENPRKISRGLMFRDELTLIFCAHTRPKKCIRKAKVYL